MHILKKFIKENNYHTIFFSLFIFCLGYLLLEGIVRGYEKESWQITEWLINYQGGFVRRGLTGEILFDLYKYFGLNSYFAILSSCFIAYLVLVVFFAKKFIRNGYPIFILPFVFFLGEPIINDSWVRKDVLLILIFILVINFSIKKSKKYLIFINALLILGLLTHEGIGFFCFPILFLIFINNNSVKHSLVKSVFISLIQLFPSILTFGLCLYNKGSLVVSGLIWDSWKPVMFPIQGKVDSQIPAAIDGLSWSISKGLSFTLDTLSNFNGGIYAPIAWFFIILLIYYLLTNTEKLNMRIFNYKTTVGFNKTNVSNILIFQFLSVLPLFILGWDYGRWVFLWVSSSFAVIVLIPSEKLVSLFPRFFANIVLKINIFLDSIFGIFKENIFLTILFIGVPACSWSGLGYMITTPIAIILQFFSKAIVIFYHIFIWGINLIKTLIF